MVTIDDNVPIPTGPSWRRKYPWDKLDIGQSFYVEGANKHTMRAGASLAGKRLGRRFIARVVDGGMRVWRIE